MSAELVFYYDVVCPYAYLASTRLDDLKARTGVTARWSPILLGGVFRAISAPDQPAAAMPPSKARLNALDIRRYAAFHDVPISFPAPGHPRRTVNAMRLCLLLDGDARVAASRSIFRAYHVDGRDPSSPETLEAACRDAGVDPALAARVEEPEAKDALRRATEVATADGVFGVPAFVVVKGGARTLFWGQDRLILVEKALAA